MGYSWPPKSLFVALLVAKDAADWHQVRTLGRRYSADKPPLVRALAQEVERNARQYR